MILRVESFCRHKGHRQAVEEMDDPVEVLIFCTTPWRSESVHIVYRVHEGKESLFRVYEGGRLVTQHLK
jgi:hypothetical protein